MHFYPAIDIQDGKFIRLKQGRLDEVTVYGDNPVEIARKFSEAGAKWIHVVDIDGAFEGKSINQKVILDIKKNCKAKIQVGGGIRTQESASFYLNNGIDRIVLGTIALENPKIIEQLCENHPGRIAVGIDAKDGMVATQGWVETSTTPATTLAKSLVGQGLRWIVHTDVSTDGAMKGPNLDAQREMALSVPSCNIIASGGVSCAEDIAQLRELCIECPNIEGVIVGKALYEKTVHLASLL